MTCNLNSYKTKKLSKIDQIKFSNLRNLHKIFLKNL